MDGCIAGVWGKKDGCIRDGTTKHDEMIKTIISRILLR